jgi:hypothetical protein
MPPACVTLIRAEDLRIELGAAARALHSTAKDLNRARGGRFCEFREITG